MRREREGKDRGRKILREAERTEKYKVKQSEGRNKRWGLGGGGGERDTHGREGDPSREKTVRKKFNLLRQILWCSLLHQVISRLCSHFILNA